MNPNRQRFLMAIQDFQSAWHRASVQEILARLTGKSNKLLSYSEVAEKLKLRVHTERGVQHIPLDSIVGSVGRYTDFTRTFLPRRSDDQERWARVKTAMEDDAGLPPIEVYKVGDAYFVIDGNHRVSVARMEGAKTIEARVLEVRTNVPLTPDVQPDDLIIKAEYADFLDTTHIMDLRPNIDLTMTIPGQYEKLMNEIGCQECLQEEEKINAGAIQSAVEDWYDYTYIPLAEAIRDRGLLRHFPDRTITDLYVWIQDNRAALEKELGWEIESDIAATDLILERSVAAEPGSWRKARTVARYTDNLFADVLVPLSGYTESWDVLDQALFIAKKENAKLRGLHIVDSREAAESERALAVKERFEKTCETAGVDGSLIIDVGDITQRISELAIVTDLIVLKVVHPPSSGVSTLISPFRSIIEHSARPVLAVPSQATQFKHALLAYDGSNQAKEALFVATYLAETWETKLTVFTALDGTKVKGDEQEYVKRYLEIHEVEAEYVTSDQGAMDGLNQAVEDYSIDLVLMGSHGGNVLQQVFIGSALDYMLRESKVPIFICR